MVTNAVHSLPHRAAKPVVALYRPATFPGKRLFDIVCSLLVIVFILSWLLPLLGLLIYLNSPGPPLFVQMRTGRRGRQFACFKLRTMYYRPSSPFEQATCNDKRITRLGAFLRKTNLDEMPQFLNVLMGDMSIVGPRPHAVQHDSQYWNMTYYCDRYRIKPGITGLAQVRGCRGETRTLVQMRHRILYDRYYIRKASLSLDLQICWWTLVQMLNRKTNGC